MVNQPVRPCNPSSYNVGIVAVREYADSFTEPWRQQDLWPRCLRVPTSCLCAFPVSGQTMDKANVDDGGIGTVVENLQSIRERWGWLYVVSTW